jgi:amidase
MLETGAFVPGELFELSVRSDGPLAGLTFAVKDLFDVAGRATGGGNPTWKETHAHAMRSAVAVQRLLDSGATAIGKTVTDELAYSIVGKNWHFGTPRNGAAPDRMPGGSSSGSASAVSNRLCDFALGTDSGGSVRVPATYCGLFGMRPSHGRIPLAGCMALTPSYDTCGWFARSASHLERIGHVLLESRRPTSSGETRLLVAPEVWSAAEEEVVNALRPVLRKLESSAGTAEQRSIFADEAQWREADRHSRNLQGFEAWRAFGDWITEAKPVFGPDIEERFKLASAVTSEDAKKAKARMAEFAQRMAEMLPQGTLMCIPTTPTVAAPCIVDPGRLQAVRLKTLQFTCIAGLARLPQVTIPVRTENGVPCGLSFIARHGDDEALLRFVSETAATTDRGMTR